MRQSDWLEIAAWMADLWPHAPLPPQTAAAWWPLLADLEADDLRAAVARLAVEPDRRFAPAVGELRQAARPPARPWGEALGELVHAAGAVGRYQPPPEFVDAALNQLVDDLGWQAICSADATDTTWRAQFRGQYKDAERYILQQEQEQVALARHASAAATPAVASLPAGGAR